MAKKKQPKKMTTGTQVHTQNKSLWLSDEQLVGAKFKKNEQLRQLLLGLAYIPIMRQVTGDTSAFTNVGKFVNADVNSILFSPPSIPGEGTLQEVITEPIQGDVIRYKHAVWYILDIGHRRVARAWIERATEIRVWVGVDVSIDPRFAYIDTSGLWVYDSRILDTKRIEHVLAWSDVPQEVHNWATIFGVSVNEARTENRKEASSPEQKGRDTAVFQTSQGEEETNLPSVGSKVVTHEGAGTDGKETSQTDNSGG